MTAVGRRAVVVLVVLCFVLFTAPLIFPYPSDKLAASSSRVYVDRNGLDLRVTASERGDHSVWCGADSMGQWIGPAVIAVEDRRFAWHPGIDPIGIARAVWSNLIKREIRSGGSTITQQLARILKPELTRGSRWKRKLVEAWDAWRLERALGKKAILAQYLNRASFGNHAVGITEAAELYFGKKPERLTPSEAAYLAGLLQAPTRLSPYRRGAQAVMVRRNWVLQKMRDIGTLDAESWRRAMAESIAIVPQAASGALFHAPHFIVAIEEGRLGSSPDSSREAGMSRPMGPAPLRIETTLDLRLQNEIEGLVTQHLESLKDKRASQSAVVVLDAHDGSILAWVGSRSFAVSQVDGVTALRQPGSTLKPFTYALAFELGKAPADLVEDAPLDELSGPDDREPDRRAWDHPAAHGEPSDGFSPSNYDRTYHGLIRMREALACSYNIPAARILRDIVGVEQLLDFLKSAGMTCLDRPPTFYGIALTLGAGEVRLIDLAAAYAMLARGGITVAPRALADQMQQDSKRLLSTEVAALITSILSDKNARAPAFGNGGPLAFSFPVAAKTGTSKDYRDNWAVGYTPRHVVAVWVGNFDGAPMSDCSGVTGAGPLFHDIMVRVGSGDGEFSIPPTLTKIDICPKSGAVSGSQCPGRVSEFFLSGREPTPICPVHSQQKSGRLEEPNTDGFRPL